MRTVGEWVGVALKMPQYVQLFADAGVGGLDGRGLAAMTDPELERVRSFAQRLRLRLRLRRVSPPHSAVPRRRSRAVVASLDRCPIAQRDADSTV